MAAIATAESTRDKILNAAFCEFYEHGFQGGSLNRIVEKAGTTKGALFHHFRNKQDLGYRVVDELIRAEVHATWVGPLLHTSDPIAELRRIMSNSMKKHPERLCRGCPLNNLAQEMAPLDDEFRQRVEAVYQDWRNAVSTGLRSGIKHGTVREGISPENVAAFIVSSLAGIVGTAKNAQSVELLKASAFAMFDYLDSLKP